MAILQTVGNRLKYYFIDDAFLKYRRHTKKSSGRVHKLFIGFKTAPLKEIIFGILIVECCEKNISTQRQQNHNLSI